MSLSSGMLNSGILKSVLLAIGLSLLAACGGGSGTSSNQDLGSGDGAYTGPPARTDDIRSFQEHFWQYLKADNRCGQCHGRNQQPTFVNPDDVNKAYAKAIKYVKLQDPAGSRFVTKVGGGHQCWLSSLSACANTIEQMISNWASASNVTSSRLIQLTAPIHRDPGDAKSFPPDADTTGTNGTSFENTVYPLLVGTSPVIANDNCQNCHTETGPSLPQAPFFASTDVDSAYQAAKSKMNIDVPRSSRFVERLEQLHNCWSDCGDDADDMTAVIDLWAQGILETAVDPTLRTSKALSLGDGIIASGGNRHESNLIALWEFKTGGGGTAFDTSGIDPAIDLTLISGPGGSVTWLDAYGLDFDGGSAQGLNFTSEKLNDFIQASGQYSVEAWVLPDNVVQEDANIVSYSGGDTQRNFTLGQDMYNYEFYNRIESTPVAPNGTPFLDSGDNGEEIAQANLQHVVVTYDQFDGRRMFVNGVRVGVADPVSGNTTINNVWDPNFAVVFGNEISGNLPWFGQLRMVAIHNRALTRPQIVQNFEVGVGAKFFLLFYVGHRIGIPESYVMFEVSQYDNFSYLFNKPTFINLDPDWNPVPVRIKGMRIGINGKEAVAGQAFATIDTTIDNSYDPQTGQELSPIGTIIALEKGAASDEFFLTFEVIGSESRSYAEALPAVPADPGDPADPIDSDIGMRTFEEINATIAEITGVPVTNSQVESVYASYLQQLPTVEDIDAFLPSHQMAIAQLAMTSCSELVETNPGFFAGFNFAESAQTAFGPAGGGAPSGTQQANRNLIIDPLMTAVMNVDQGDATNNLTSQPSESEIVAALGAGASQNLDTGVSIIAYDSLITQLINTCTPVPPSLSCTLEDTPARTAQIVKAVCAAAAGGAVMVVQ